MAEVNDRHHVMSTSASATSGVSGSGRKHQRRTMTSSVSSSSGVSVAASLVATPGGGRSMVQVPLVKDTLTFDGRQATRLREMERRIESDMRRKKREWEHEVEKMREEFLQLYPSDRVWGSDEMLNDPLVSRRCGSTDILDAKKMRTLFMDYPDSGRRYKIRFNVAGCDPKTVRVSTDGERIVVRGTKFEEEGGAGREYFRRFQTSSISGRNGGLWTGRQTLLFDGGREYCRKIQKPKDVDHTKFKAYLTADSILVVEAPVPPSTLSLRKVIHSPSHSHAGSTHSRSPSGSPAAGPDTPSKEKIGVPIFREESGQRRLHLVVDLGASFRPQDITVQVIKENKIQVRAKHEEKTAERLCKSKFSKEYELGEKIETYSLTGGMSGDGRLYVGAYAKGHGNGFTSSKSGALETSGPTATSGQATTSGPTNDDDEAAQNSSSSLQPCHVLSASATSSQTA